MTPRLKITKNVIERIGKVQASNKPATGCLFGLMYDSTLLVVGFIIEGFNNQERDTDNDVDSFKCYNQVNLNFPTEVDLCGLVAFSDSIDVEKTSSADLDILHDVEITDNPVVISCQFGTTSMKAHVNISERWEEISYEVVSETDLWKQFVHVRLQTCLPLVCELQRDLVREGLQALRKKIASGMVSFHFPKSRVFLMSSDADTGLSGLTGEPSIGELWDMSMGPSEGPTGKKKKQGVREIDVLHIELLMKPTRDIHLEVVNKSAPAVQYIKRSFECLNLMVRVDTLSMVNRSTKVVRLYGILIDSICRSLRLTERDLMGQMEDGDNISVPEPFHFFPVECGHFITMMYPKRKSEENLKPFREILHHELGLALDRPYFRRANKYLFRDEITSNQPLINPHEGLINSVKEGEVSLVQGLYSYHHYMQDNMDDNGWGCAYRSLQTLVSWFKWQGYYNEKVPSHREIQQCLVHIGDKPSNFLGTKQWIGSTEVSFVLETLLGVSSRIMRVETGEELGSRGGELAAHFATQGTPIMIGGGVLAHTILGVDYNKQSGELKFLILDPHYTGGEDLGVIQGKGWCGWKGINFWNKSAFYNLCLPQRPKCI